jgi:hypothetical protein
MCELNPSCTQTPNVVVTVGPDESVLGCCGVAVGSSSTTAETERDLASP